MSLPTNNSPAPAPVVMVAPPTTVPGPIVPVIPSTPGHLISRYLSTCLGGIGALILAAQSASPYLQTLFPRNKALGPAIMAAGAAWKTIQQFLDQRRVQATNYSPPAS